MSDVKIPNLSNYGDPIGPLRDKKVITIATADYVDERGFLCQVGTDGNLTYRTLAGTEDLTETSMDAGDFVNVAGIPVIVTAVRGSSTVTSITIGIL